VSAPRSIRPALRSAQASGWRGAAADLAALPLPNEAEVLAQVLSRLRADLPYTKAGAGLLAVNPGPGKWLAAGSADEGLRQRVSRAPAALVLPAAGAGASTAALALPPHPFVEARAAMLRCCPLGAGANAVDHPQVFVMLGGNGSGKSHTVTVHAQTTCGSTHRSARSA